MRSSLIAIVVSASFSASCAVANPAQESKSYAIDAPLAAAFPSTSSTITRIAFGSCNDEEKPAPIWATIAAENPQLFLFTGDNVYADYNRGERIKDMTAEEIQYAWNTLSSKTEFTDFYTKIPMMFTWDDHDYGKNDMGQDFALKDEAKAMMLDFFSVPESAPMRQRDGVYNSQIIGEAGNRVQIIMLDTRYFRSSLTKTDEYGAVGKQRYIPSADPEQDMLGEAQWAWLQKELQKDADLRIVVSSLQLISDTHGWEAWRTMPIERERFYDVLGSAKGGRTVVISGDRHVGGIYRDDRYTDFPIYEVTSSSLNLSFNEEKAITDEWDRNQLGLLYGPENYGMIDIDWEASLLNMSLKDIEGKVVRAVTIPFGEISSGTKAQNK